jgi:hypothetical protein
VTEAATRRRAQRLVALYPAAWRERYGAEFLELLTEEMHERPRSARRAIDVSACAVRARLAAMTSAGAAVVFAPAAIAVWSQLTIGWQWSDPGSPATRAGMLLMCGALVGLAAWGLLALVPVVVLLGRSLLPAESARRCGPPAAVALLAGAVLVAGSVHFGHGWPGTGGHPWRGRELVPAPVARFGWAATFWVTS